MMRQEILAPVHEDWTISHVPTAEDIDCHRALLSLIRWDRINADHHNEKRVARRLDYWLRPSVKATIPFLTDDGQAEDERTVCFEVWGRNVSQSGVSFLSFRELIPCIAVDDSATILTIDDIFRVGMVIGLELSGDVGGTMYVTAEIMRLREVVHKIYEFGVKFVDRDGPENH